MQSAGACQNTVVFRYEERYLTWCQKVHKDCIRRALAKLHLFFAMKREISLCAKKVHEECKSARACQNTVVFRYEERYLTWCRKVHEDCISECSCQITVVFSLRRE